MTDIKQQNKNRMVELAMASKGVTAEQLASMSSAEIIERRIPQYIVNHAKNTVNGVAVIETPIETPIEQPLDEIVVDEIVDQGEADQVPETDIGTGVETVIVEEPNVPEQEVVEESPSTDLRDLTADETANLLAAYATAGTTTMKKLLLVAKTVLGDEVELISTNSITDVTRTFIADAKAK